MQAVIISRTYSRDLALSGHDICRLNGIICRMGRRIERDNARPPALARVYELVGVETFLWV